MYYAYQCKECAVTVLKHKKVEGDVYCTTHQPAVFENNPKNKEEESFMETVKNNTKKGYDKTSQEVERLVKFLFGNLNADEEEVIDAEVVESNTKEEKKMEKKKFTVNFGAMKEVVADAGRSVKRFVKRHAGKSLLGLGSLLVAGTFTSGLTAALAVGTGIYATIALIYEYIQAKKEQKEVERKAILNALGDSVLYGTVGGMSLYCLTGILVSALSYAFVYSYVAFAYMGYFILA